MSYLVAVNLSSVFVMPIEMIIFQIKFSLATWPLNSINILGGSFTSIELFFLLVISMRSLYNDTCKGKPYRKYFSL